MFIKVMDYNGDKHNTSVKWEQLSKIKIIEVTVISGDEVMTITFEDGTKKTFDAGENTRSTDYFDDHYILYDVSRSSKDNAHSVCKFMKRRNSYE